MMMDDGGDTWKPLKVFTITKYVLISTDPLRTGFPSQRLDSHVSHPRSVSNSTEAMESLKRQNEEEVEEDEEEEVEVEVEVELPYEDYTRPR